MVAPRFFINNGESKKTNSIAQKKPIVLKKINASDLFLKNTWFRLLSMSDLKLLDFDSIE